MFVEGEFGDFDGGVFFAEVTAGPGIAEEDDVLVEGVFGVTGAGGKDGGFEGFGRDIGSDPAHDLPGSAFETAVRAVFGLHAVLDDFELERADGSQEGDALGRVLRVNSLDDAFLEQLLETFAEAFELAGVGALKPGEDFGSEAGDFAVNEG